MSKNTKLQSALILFICTMLVACDFGHQHKGEIVPSGTGKSDYILANSTTDFKGARTNDTSLKAIIIPCQDNNTFRLYYSDSVTKLGFPDSLTVVSYGKRTRLAYKECCIEVTSSVGDTWLSTGYNKFKFAAGTGPISAGSDSLIWLQHFTSTPQSDSTSVAFNLVPE